MCPWRDARRPLNTYRLFDDVEALLVDLKGGHLLHDLLQEDVLFVTVAFDGQLEPTETETSLDGAPRLLVLALRTHAAPLVVLPLPAWGVRSQEGTTVSFSVSDTPRGPD